jgi:hypothetical protein
MPGSVLRNRHMDVSVLYFLGIRSLAISIAQRETRYSVRLSELY